MNTTSFRQLILLLGAVLAPAAIGAQTPVQIRGIVRDSAGRPVARAEASVRGDSAIAITNDSGGFTLATLRKRNVVVRIRRLGYEPAEKDVDLPDTGSVTKTFTLTAIPQSMMAFHVVARRTGVWGVVRSTRGVPLPGVQVEMLGTSAKPVTTDSAGEFSIPTQKAGTYIVLARRKGYAYAQTSVTITPDAGEEAEIVLFPLTKESDLRSGFGRMEYVFRETATRIAFKSSRSSVVTHDDLLKNGASILAYALCGTEAFTRSGARCPVLAACVIVNGDHESAIPLQGFETSEVETVEFYPSSRADWSKTTESRGCSRGPVAVVWLRETSR